MTCSSYVLMTANIANIGCRALTAPNLLLLPLFGFEGFPVCDFRIDLFLHFIHHIVG